MSAHHTYLFFAGDCATAMRDYARVLDGRLELRSYSSGPPEMAARMGAANAERIMHARLEFDGGTIMAGDYPAEMPYDGMKGFCAVLHFAGDAARVKRVYDALADGARELRMPLQKTFWSDAYSMFVDRHGTPWMVMS